MGSGFRVGAQKLGSDWFRVPTKIFFVPTPDQEELAAVRDVCFHEYVEPILVEEEAIAQIQLWLRKTNWIHKKVRIIFRFLFLQIIFKLAMIVFLT